MDDTQVTLNRAACIFSRVSTHMDAICFLVGSEEGVGHWHLDDLNGSALGIWCAGQPVVGIQRNLML